MPPICPGDLRTTKEDLEGTPHQNCNETAPHLKTKVGICIPRHGEIRCNLLYPVCRKCPATYVGETKRKLCKRMDEHKSTVRMADFNVSAIAEHAWNAGHGVDWNGVTILDQHKDLHPRLPLEMFKVGSIVLMLCTLMISFLT